MTTSIHIGMRGTFYDPHIFDTARELGCVLIRYEELRQRGVADVVAELKDRLTGRSVYSYRDMDFFDPSCAPGVCAPISGGPGSEEGLHLLRGLACLKFVA